MLVIVCLILLTDGMNVAKLQNIADYLAHVVYYKKNEQKMLVTLM